MTSSSNPPKGDNASTYMVQSGKKKEELQRLVFQSRMITEAIGGVLPEQPNANAFRHVLDIACGTGGWVIEMAQAYPEMRLVGVDISTLMIDYARTKAEEQGVADRVEFHVMDALKKLDFPDNSFDLVNMRFAVSFVRTWDWPALLLEMQRVVRPGGIVRTVECETTESTSQALTQIYETAVHVLYRAGHLFTQDKTGLTHHLAELLTKSWCEDVQTKSSPLVFRAGTPEGENFKEDQRYVFQTTRPFVQKWIGIPEDYDALLRQAHHDMEQPDFSATWTHVIAWGHKPLTGRSNSTHVEVPTSREKKEAFLPSSNNSPKDDKASTYMVQSSKKKEELQRLVLQSRMITAITGGVLPEQSDANAFRRVLDVACGTGGWAIEAARTYPEMSLVGIDINPMMTDYARMQAKEQGLADRVEFREMDALKKLDFPDNSFNLVNLRFGGSFVRTWDWPALLLEMQRVVRPGGIIRWSENEMGADTTSPALMKLFDIGMRAFFRAGYIFAQDREGLTSHMAELLTKSWCENVQVKTHSIPFRAGTPEGQMYIDDIQYLYVTVTPFYRKWGGLPENYDALYQQALKDMRQSNFSVTWPHITAWGSKPLARSYTSTGSSVASRQEKDRTGAASSSKSVSDNSASTYMVQDSKKKAELQRQISQSQLLNAGMGGVLAEQSEPGAFQRVLDVACGPGGWLLETAKTYPEMQVVGIDINPVMIEYARTQAKEQGLIDNVELQVMDALEKLEFPDNSFDLVNLRFGVSFVRTWDWPRLLLEMQRVVRPGGVIRLTEGEISNPSNSQAFIELSDLFMRALYRAGHLFTQESGGLTNHLAELLTKSWCDNVQVKAYSPLFRVGTPGGDLFKEDTTLIYQTVRPFIQKFVGLPDNYDTLYQQVCKDMEQPDFFSTWPIVTVWGNKPLPRAE